MRCETRIVLLLLAAAAVVSVANAGTRAQARAEQWIYHTLVPLGFEQFQLLPQHTPLLLMATAESPQFEGWQRVRRQHSWLLIDGSGVPVRQYPERIDFRVTASARHTAMLNYDKPTELVEPGDIDALLLQLTFKVKVFRGLKAYEVEPVSVRQLGMPPDVPYDERIYLVSFDLKDVPAEDRIVLEVFTPDGQRVCKFHLELL